VSTRYAAVSACLDDGVHPGEGEVADDELVAVPLACQDFRGEWSTPSVVD
jgi:hypothetical protein